MSKMSYCIGNDTNNAISGPRKRKFCLDLDSSTSLKPLPFRESDFISRYHDTTHPSAFKETTMTVSGTNPEALFRRIMPQTIGDSRQNQPQDLDLSFLKSPHPGQTSFPPSSYRQPQSSSGPELSSSSSSSTSFLMDPADPDSPPSKKVGMFLPPKSRLNARKPSSTGELPLRSLTQEANIATVSTVTTPSSLPPPKPKSKAFKNQKNLAVRTNIHTLDVSSLPTARFPSNLAPIQKYQVAVSPIDPPGVPFMALQRPALPPLRQTRFAPANLSIQTPVTGNSQFRGGPLTPLTSRAHQLRHFQSSSSLKAPTSHLHATPCAPIKDNPNSDELAADADDDESISDFYEPNFDVPQSQEEKPDGYPDGPIRIYGSGIDLYSEPSKETASKYDVIINVASEIPNPFDSTRPPFSLSKFRNNRSIINDPIKPAAHEKGPEYIHVPWEHNTEIVEDLKILVQLMKNRVSAGKTILVHCQLGVSRSASLIVAYGMYRRPDKSVQNMYEAVKARSPWIGPNMTLIMQLQEFHNVLNSSDGIGSSLRRASDENLSSQCLIVPDSYGVAAPLKSAPLTGTRSSVTPGFFDFSPDVLSGGSRFESAFSPRLSGPVTTQSGTISMSQPATMAMPPPPPSSAHTGFCPIQPPQTENTPQNPHLGSVNDLTSPRSDRFAKHLQYIHSSLTSPTQKRQSASFPRSTDVLAYSPTTNTINNTNTSVGSSVKMAGVLPAAQSFWPQHNRLGSGPQENIAGFLPLAQTQNNSVPFRRRPQDIVTMPPAHPTSFGISLDDPRSPVQNGHTIRGAP